MALGGDRQPAVFMDKDGTLIEDVPFNVDPDRMTLTRGAAEAAAALHAAGYALVVVSNQPGVALGRFPERALAGVEARLRALIAPAPLSAFACCPHDGAASPPCDCRKPAPGMLVGVAAERGFDLDASWMIGDILDDVEAGRAAGCRTILLDRGGETEWKLAPARSPHYRCRTLLGAAQLILASRHNGSNVRGTVVAGPRRGKA